MKKFFKENKAFLAVIAAIFVVGIAAGAFFLIKNKPVKEQREEIKKETEEQKREETSICNEEEKICPNGSIVKRTPPDCELPACPGEKEGILVSSPKSNQKIQSPLLIKGEARGNWFFEAIFNVELYDADGNLIAKTILKTKEDWMTENFVSFEGKLTFNAPKTSSGTLKFLNANPSGLPEFQNYFEVPVLFGETSNKKIKLYYYQPEKDKDNRGNILCTRAGLEAVEREIPVSKTPIQDAIRLLLEGKLTLEEKTAGLATEYPLEGFKLSEVSLKDGILTLRFEDPLHKTSGGSCRTNIMWLQIEATAKQFSEVKKVHFLPEDLFQP